MERAVTEPTGGLLPTDDKWRIRSDCAAAGGVDRGCGCVRMGRLGGVAGSSKCRAPIRGSALGHGAYPHGVGQAGTGHLRFRRTRAKAAKNRVHLDVRVGTGLESDERLSALQAESDRLVTLGAAQVKVLHADGVDESCIVVQDIEGNEFCLD
ncbi:VOC family protein [Rhodococcus pyridinivorans]|uniref:VOC family protein n=1 Tax=Rhodococcus pyridinivorans TaxID=103816 RepID=UPI0034641B6F